MTDSKFSKTWKCPNCGSGKRLLEEAWAEIHNGQPSPGLTTEGKVYALPLLPTELVPKGVHTLKDICYECGTEYIYKAEIVKGMLQATPPSGQPFPHMQNPRGN